MHLLPRMRRTNAGVCLPELRRRIGAPPDSSLCQACEQPGLDGARPPFDALRATRDFIPRNSMTTSELQTIKTHQRRAKYLGIEVDQSLVTPAATNVRWFASTCSGRKTAATDDTQVSHR